MGLKPILFYHKNCPDGFGAAYAFWKTFKDGIEYYPIDNYDKIPDIEPRDVYMVDISFDREPMLKLKEQATNLVVLDHHVTNRDKLQGLDFFHYNVNKSGSVLAWEYLNPNKEVPMIFQCIQDRDIYSWEVKSSKEILAVLDSEPYDFACWSDFESKLDFDLGRVIEHGNTIIKYNKNLMKRLKRDAYRTTILGYDVPVVNLPFFKSDVLHDLCRGEAFAAAYHFDGTRYVFSLRSDEDGVDVAKIAETFGGGGHARASGFPLSDLKMLNKGVK